MSFAPLPAGPFGTIVVDPPWPEAGPMHVPVPTRDAAPVGTPYSRLSYEEIAALPVGAVAAAKSHLYLWATQRSLRTALSLAELWGFENKAVLTWCKAGLGMGFHYYRHSTEFVVFAVRGCLPTSTNNTGTWFHGKKGAHSAKPASFFEMVEANSPAERLELFARGKRPGWTVWGDEV